MCVGEATTHYFFICVCPFLFFPTIFPIYVDFDIYYGTSVSALATTCAVTSIEEFSLFSEDI